MFIENTTPNLSNFFPEKKLKIVGIFRKSNQKRLANGNLSLVSSIEETQEPMIIEYCNNHNIELVKTYSIIETGGTKATNTRDKFNEIIEKSIQDNSIDGFITFNVTRFTRNLSDAGLAERVSQSKTNKKIFIFLQDDIILDSARFDYVDMKSRYSKEVSASANTFYTAQKNQQITLNTKIQQGKIYGKHKFGYKKNPDLYDEINSIPDELNSKIVKRIFELYITGEYSYLAIRLEILNEFGVSPVKSKIEKILQDKFYIGINTTIRNNSVSQYPHIYEKLITNEAFEKARIVREKRTNFSHKNKKLLSDFGTFQGLIKCDCSECNHTLSPDTKTRSYKNGNKAKFGYYFCNGYSKGNKIHDRNSISYYEIENQVTNTFSDLAFSEKILNQVIEKMNRNGLLLNQQKESEIFRLRNEIAKLNSKKSNLIELFTDQSITKQEWEVSNQNIKSRISECELKISKLEKYDPVILQKTSDLLRVIPKIPKLYQVANNLEKRKIVSSVYSDLRVR